MSLIPVTTSQTSATTDAMLRVVNGHASITTPANLLVTPQEDEPPPVGQRRVFNGQHDRGNALKEEGHPNPEGQQQDRVGVAEVPKRENAQCQRQCTGDE